MLRVVSTGDTITCCCTVSIIAIVIGAAIFSDSIKLPKKKLLILVIVSVMERLRGRLATADKNVAAAGKDKETPPTAARHGRDEDEHGQRLATDSNVDTSSHSGTPKSLNAWLSTSHGESQTSLV